MENRYCIYLPDTVIELQEFQKLGEIEGKILDEAAAEKDALVRNQWIQTAERSGLLRYAKMMGVLGAAVMETEGLREEVLSRWNSRSPYTMFHLQDWLDSCLGADAYTLTMEKEQYRLQLLLALCVKEKQSFLRKQLRKVIPAHLVLDVILELNTYGELYILTHGQLWEAGLTYGRIPSEELLVFQV